MTGTQGLRRGFLAALALTLALRLWIAAAMPMTGDEAYFYWWGRFPDWGFYDHPPMIGWWLALLTQVSHAEWWLRLPAVLQPALLAWACGAWVARRDAAAGWLAALLVLLAPANVWNVFVTTDTPLVYFSVLSALAFLRAAEDDDPRWYLAAGALLAGAVLSKYFSVFLGLAYVAHGLWRPSRRKLAGLVLVFLPVLPALGLMAWWNSGHCWSNVMFNIYNRHGDAGMSWSRPLLYALTLAYLLAPVAWLLARGQVRLAPVAERPELRALFIMAALPLAVFALLSLVKTVGLHWLLSFVPLVLLLVARLVPAARLALAVRVAAGFALLHLVAIVAIALVPMEAWRPTRHYDGIVMTFRADDVLRALAPWRGDFVLMTDGYSPAVTLGYNAGAYVPVFGEASSHARHDDILTDFRALDGRNIVVLLKQPPERTKFEPYFDRVEYRELELHGARFHLAIGRGFRYAPYRDKVLALMRSRWYGVPSFLPMKACYFCDRYFPGSSCRRP